MSPGHAQPQVLRLSLLATFEWAAHQMIGFGWYPSNIFFLLGDAEGPRHSGHK
jgi:hypothetical protein